MYQPWKWLQRGNYSRFSHCRNGTKLLLALKVLLDDISPELQYLPRKYNSEFFVCTHRTQRNEPKNRTYANILPKHNLVFAYITKLYFRLQRSSMKSSSPNSHSPSDGQGPQTIIWLYSAPWCHGTACSCCEEQMWHKK